MSKKQRGISFFHPASLIATCFGLGKFPVLPGTLGSVFALFFVVVIAVLPRYGLFSENYLLPVFSLITIAIFILGVWASNLYVLRTGKKDPSEIIIDEVIGMFVTVLMTGLIYAVLLAYDHDKFFPFLVLSPLYLLVMFFLFRLFDIWKPGFIGKVDREMEGGIGVVMDDVIAGIYAAVTFYILFFTLFYTDGFLYIFQQYFPQFVE